MSLLYHYDNSGIYNVFEHYDAVMRLRACADIYETISLSVL